MRRSTAVWISSQALDEHKLRLPFWAGRRPTWGGSAWARQAKAKEDAAMIARRKRMLQIFLNRISRHPILSNEHVFHRFLDGEVSWVWSDLFTPCSRIHRCFAFLSDGSLALPTNLLVTQEHPEGTLA